jgi:hypothetical protein
MVPWKVRLSNEYYRMSHDTARVLSARVRTAPRHPVRRWNRGYL